MVRIISGSPDLGIIIAEATVASFMASVKLIGDKYFFVYDNAEGKREAVATNLVYRVIHEEVNYGKS